MTKVRLEVLCADDAALNRVARLFSELSEVLSQSSRTLAHFEVLQESADGRKCQDPRKQWHELATLVWPPLGQEPADSGKNQASASLGGVTSPWMFKRPCSRCGSTADLCGCEEFGF